MVQLALLCRAAHTLNILAVSGLIIAIPKGKTIRLLDAYTQEHDDTDIAVFHHEVDGEGHVFECELEHVMPHLVCEELV